MATPPKTYQLNAIDSGVLVFSECKRLLDVAGQDPQSRAAAISQHGTLLLEAPTGSGKTLIAAHLAERFSNTESVVWFWFAPFKGVSGQSAAALRVEFPGLRLRELSEDRQAADSRAGDVFVTTWQTVATRARDRRNVHKRGEQNPTVEELVQALRAKGIRIGVVIDEAHHGFFGGGAETQSMRFFRETLAPEYTLLVTATPDDEDIRKFQTALGIARLNRITIGRREPVDEGLIKEGIKCVAYFAPEGQQKLVDFEETALREGTALHHRLKQEIAQAGGSLTPLMLVQVDSDSKGVERAKEKLLALGFSESQIAIHTADEPDADLLALANDETREVLIFKMAVALGFDAPRAFTLVSMRAARDVDFGVQLVGRILRVHRRLQSRAREKSLPPILRYGYVLLADAQSQAGLDLAGQKINRLHTAYATVSPTTAIVQLGNQTFVQVVGQGGQTQLFPVLGTPTGPASGTVREPLALELLTGRFAIPTAPPTSSEGSSAYTATAAPTGGFRYSRRRDVPHWFKTQIVSPNNDVTEEDCAKRFIVSSDHLLRALVSKVQVERRTLEVFSQQLEIEFANAAMDARQAALTALKILSRNESFDPRELRRALVKKLKTNLSELGIDADRDDQVGHMLNVILCAQPDLLFAAQKAALAASCEVVKADEAIPEELVSDIPLRTSRHNVYGVYPSGLNTWEQPFAEHLDRDNVGVVRWWHRNLPHKPWSVQVVLDTGGGFFPDFIIGIEGRKCEDGALLADPKFAFEITQELPKSRAAHPLYGRVLILSLQGGSQWMTVRYDERQNRALLDREFSFANAAGY